MAIITRGQSATNAGGVVPEQTYRVRCIGTKYTAKNSSGNPMTTLSCEIIEPEMLTIDGKPVNMAGRPFAMYLTHNFEKSGWGSQDEVFETCEKLGIELPLAEDGTPGYDESKHEEYFKGIEFDMVLTSREEIKKFTAGPKKGDPILDGEGKEISSGHRINARPSDILHNCHPSRNAEVAARPF